MMRLAALFALMILIILPSSAQSKTLPWERNWEDDPPTYHFSTNDGLFWVFEREIKADKDGGFRLWLHGDHSRNAKVAYHTSLWYVRLDCSDRVYLDAFTTFDSNGATVDSWDGVGRGSHIRPGTMYQTLESFLCK